ncbi:MAG TPA: hypothetical protein VMV44_12960 [Rectinemataceae bacterium]|nr:hypothetical protein [Rectinemataceae bacterium]
MLNDLEERAIGLISVVNSIGKESEDVYLTMGRLFPAIIAETGRSARLATDSLSSFDRLSGGGRGRTVEEMTAFVTEASSWFKGLHERDEDFLRRINESMETLASLDGLIKGVRMDSEDMEIVSLNAMTVALKSGFAGRAFSVITDELKRLSTQTIALTEAITVRGQNLLEVFSTLRDAVSRLDRFQRDFFDRLEASVLGAFERHRRELDEVRGLFSELIGEAGDIKGPVQAIMQEVQHQDIVRQSLGHVVISLSEAEEAARRRKSEAASEEEEIAYVASIARLSAQLIEDIVGKIDASAVAFERNINDVESRVAGIERRRLDSAANSASAGETGDGVSETNRYDEMKRAVTLTARKLADQVRSLDDSFKSLATLLSRFKNIVVASRIEIAKNRSLSSVTTTVVAMVELTGKIEDDVTGAMGTTKGFAKVAEAAMTEYAESSASIGLESEDQGLEVGGEGASNMRRIARDAKGISLVLSKVREDLASLEERRAMTGKAIVDFALFTPEFLTYIRDARTALAGLRGLSGRLAQAKDELSDLETRAIAALGGEIDREIHSDRLQEMIQRFTIFTHKRAVGDIANFKVEEGGETGEITLF